MSKFSRVNCSVSTYIESLHRNRNTNLERSTLVGNILDTNTEKNNICMSLLKFDVPKLNKSKVLSASLFLYVENIETYSENFKNILISPNNSDFSLKSLSWNTPPKVSNSDVYEVTVPINKINKYIEIDITSMFNLWLKGNNFGLTIASRKSKAISLIHFASINSNKPPYILINIENDEKVIPSISNDIFNSFNVNTPSIRENTFNNNCDILERMEELEEKYNILNNKLDKICRYLNNIEIDPIE